MFRTEWVDRMSRLASVPERPVAHVYNAAYTGVPNWDIGRPQRAFVQLIDAGIVRSPVLDVGCGTGELSLFFARHGYDVLGIDLSTMAIQQARDKARWRRISAQFLVWDALNISAFRSANISFRTVVDSAMLHILGDRERDRFIDELGAVIDRGGLYCVLGDARRTEQEIYGITPEEIRARFSKTDGWKVVFAYSTTFQRRWSNNAAYFIGVQRQ